MSLQMIEGEIDDVAHRLAKCELLVKRPNDTASAVVNITTFIPDDLQRLRGKLMAFSNDATSDEKKPLIDRIDALFTRVREARRTLPR